MVDMAQRTKKTIEKDLTKVDGKSSSSAGAAVQKFFLDNPSVKYVRFQWIDFTGILRFRVITKSFALQLAAENKPIPVQSPMSSAVHLGGLMFDLIQLGTDGLYAQWETLKATPHTEGHASVFCHTKDCNKDLITGYELDPRSVLKNKVAKIKEEQGLEFLVGYEIEFLILEKNPTTGKEEPVSFPFAHWAASTYRNKCGPIMDEIVDALNEAGIEVRQYHTESVGMFEISTDPLPPVEAVDALYFAQETIRTICYKHGLRATMHPQPFEGGDIVGTHTHFSIVNCEGEDMADSFTAGVLQSMPGLMAIGMSNWVSYARKGMFMGWVAWADDYKMTPYRRVTPIEDHHFEVRWPDAITNHYLMLTALFGVGSAAVKEELELTIKPRNTNAFELSPKEREETGVTTKLPANIGEALNALKEDEAIKKEFGTQLFDRYLLNKTREMEYFEKISTEAKRRAVTAPFF